MNVRKALRIIALAPMLVSTLSLAALVQRNFVSGTGLDTNPCTLAQPCRSFGAAIAKTVAGGEVIVLDSAGYGPVTITQSMSLIAPPGVYAGITAGSGQTGITVDAAGATVVLRGLSINGLAGSVYGIRVINAARLRIEGCTISNLGSIGIVQGATGAETVVLDTVVRDNGGRGFSMVIDATAVFDNVRVEHNGGDGIYFTAAASRATATIRRSVLAHNAAAGVAAVLPASLAAVTSLDIEDSTIVNNGGDGIFAGGTGGGGLNGDVFASVRRNSVADNAYSGISVFAPSADFVSVNVVDNTFSDNPTSAIKAEGSLAVQVYASRNAFTNNGLSFDTVSSAKTYTFQDNEGDYTATIAPVAKPRF